MQTPISFALEILLDCETIEKAHKACRKYIKALEGEQHKKPFNNAIGAFNPTGQAIGGPMQAPSTQRLLEAQATTIGMVPMTPAISAAQRIVGGEVNTGNGTRGPKKW